MKRVISFEKQPLVPDWVILVIRAVIRQARQIVAWKKRTRHKVLTNTDL
jgi:hypothetical protein